MTLDTWVSLGGLLVAALGIYAPLRAGLGRIERELAGTRQKLEGDIDGLRIELKADINDLRGELKADIARLDDRVYALAAGLRPVLEQAREPRPRGLTGARLDVTRRRREGGAPRREGGRRPATPP